MKPLVSFLLLIVLVGCHKNTDIGPVTLLNQRWQFSQGRGVNDSTWFAPYRAYIDDTEYRSDGTLIYRRNGVVKSVQCCVPGKFELAGNVIRYTEFPNCPFSLCAATGNAAIRILRDDLLELESNEVITQYTPVE